MRDVPALHVMAANLLRGLAASEDVRAAGGDFVCSPTGLWLVLAAVAAGAGGETAAGFRAVLGAAGPDAAREVGEMVGELTATDALAVATGVWSRAPVRDGYRTSLPDVAFGPLGDRTAIDAWVRGATRGLVDGLAAPVSPAVRLLLVNALALRARWESAFEAGRTRPRDFRDAAGRVHQVPTMHGDIPRRDAWTTPGGVTVVELACKAVDGVPGARVRFVLGPPDAGAAEVLPAAWSAERVRVDAERVVIALPRLELRTVFDLKPHLGALGLRLATTAAADLSGMSAEPLHLEQAAQSCVLKVTELGVEAASATETYTVLSVAVRRRVLRIAFDRPFGIVVLPAEGDVPLFTAWQATAPVDPGPEQDPQADADEFADLPETYRRQESEPDDVRRMTVVPFLPDGSCLAVRRPDGTVRLPYGVVQDGEVWLRDAALRIPLETAGFRIQRVRPFGYATEGRHVFARAEGDRYEGRRPHADLPWLTGTPQEVAAMLTDSRQGALVLEADRSRREETEETFFADSVRLTELSYLREGGTAEEGSGFGAGPEQWRVQRRMVVDGLDADGTFLDLGCANGLLMESVVAWAAQDGRTVEPYGVDLAPGLVAEARRRLPHWADRIAEGNALDWVPADGRRFDFVHVLADLVPPARFPGLVRHALDRLVAPGGRLLVSVYQPAGGTAPDAAQRLAAAGVEVAGSASGTGAPRTATTAWTLA